MNKIKNRLLGVGSAIVVCMTAFAFSVAAVPNASNASASAETEKIFYDTVYFDDNYFGGEESTVDADYTVECDRVETVEDVHYYSVPSFGNKDTSLKGYCGPLTGLNIVGFYDRWYTELIPDYTPGVALSNGNYRYYPDFNRTQTTSALKELYNLMKVPEVGGATSANFKSGMSTYFKNAGCTIGFTSCYSSKTSVNLQSVKTAVSQNKVGMVMCGKYNFVKKITINDSETQVEVTKVNGSVGHMMMVTGYKILAYYKNGANFRTDTFLYACSGYSSGATGYILLNEHLSIDEAYIINVS